MRVQNKLTTTIAVKPNCIGEDYSSNWLACNFDQSKWNWFKNSHFDWTQLSVWGKVGQS